MAIAMAMAMAMAIAMAMAMAMAIAMAMANNMQTDELKVWAALAMCLVGLVSAAWFFL
jgi:hypothetical protein